MATDFSAGVTTRELLPGVQAVIKRRSNVPLVTIALAARAGVFTERGATAGLTGLMARASIKGTHTRTAAQIADQAEHMGGSVSPSVSADLFDWEISVPARHFRNALELVCDVAFNAAFPVDEFAVERKLTLADLQHSRDDMYRYPLRLCLQQAFRGHAYGNTIADVESSITKAEAATVAAWHAEQLKRGTWLFIVGDVDPDEAVQLAHDTVRPVAVTAETQPTAEWGGASVDREVREKAQSALALAFPGPTRNHDDSHTLQVLANAVGGLGGRFFEELRSKRSLAYTVALLPVARWLGGAFVSYIATSPERETEARNALLEQFDMLCNDLLPAAEIERSQRYTIGTWQIRSQTNGSQLSDLMHAYMLGPGISEIQQYGAKIRAVTAEMIRDCAQKYFDVTQLVEGVVRGELKS